MTPLPLPSQTLAWLKHAADAGQRDAQALLHLIARADKRDQDVAEFVDRYSKTIAALCRRLEALERGANLRQQDEDAEAAESDSIADDAQRITDAATQIRREAATMSALDHAGLIAFALGREPWSTWLQKGGCLESAHCELSDLMLAVLARWGHSTPPAPPAPYIDPQGEDADKQLLEVFYRQMGRGLEVHPETLLRGIRGVRAFQFASSSSSRLAPADVQRIIEAFDFCIGDSDRRANSGNHHRLRQRLKRTIATLPSPATPPAPAAPGPVEPESEKCETCDGEGTIDERLGGISTSNPAATCPDCDGVGEPRRLHRQAPAAPTPSPDAYSEGLAERIEQIFLDKTSTPGGPGLLVPDPEDPLGARLAIREIASSLRSWQCVPSVFNPSAWDAAEWLERQARR